MTTQNNTYSQFIWTLFLVLLFSTGAFFALHNLVPNTSIQASKTNHDYLTEDNALLNLLQGTKISILGDSISTYCTSLSRSTDQCFSSNPTYNNTIESNAIYYSQSELLANSPSNTYWSKQINYLDPDTIPFQSANHSYWQNILERFSLRLLVNNSSSGDTMLKGGFIRAEQLHDNVGIHNPRNSQPQIVLIKMLINDYVHHYQKGSIKDIKLKNYRHATHYSPRTNNYSFSGYTPISAIDASAYSIYKINLKYNNPAIFMFNLPPDANRPDNLPTNHNSRLSFNAELQNIARLFPNVTIVDIANSPQYSGSAWSHFFHDHSTHPNLAGMLGEAETLRQAFVKRYLSVTPSLRVTELNGLRFVARTGINSQTGHYQPSIDQIAAPRQYVILTKPHQRNISVSSPYQMALYEFNQKRQNTGETGLNWRNHFTLNPSTTYYKVAIKRSDSSVLSAQEITQLQNSLSYSNPHHF